MAAQCKPTAVAVALHRTTMQNEFVYLKMSNWAEKFNKYVY
jgi:hypothetical protein